MLVVRLCLGFCALCVCLPFQELQQHSILLIEPASALSIFTLLGFSQFEPRLIAQKLHSPHGYCVWFCLFVLLCCVAFGLFAQAWAVLVCLLVFFSLLLVNAVQRRSCGTVSDSMLRYCLLLLFLVVFAFTVFPAAGLTISAFA